PSQRTAPSSASLQRRPLASASDPFRHHFLLKSKTRGRDSSGLLPGRPDDAAKTKMTGGSIDGLGHARCRSITPAVVRRAEMRSAFHNFARDLDVRHVGIVAFVSVAASGVEARAARLWYLFVLLVPIRRPLPHVAGHVVEPVTI